MHGLRRRLGASFFALSTAAACGSTPVEPARETPATEPIGAAPDAAPTTSSEDAGRAVTDAAAPGDCVRAGTHRMPGTQCCAGDDGGGTVKEYALCCRPVGGACDVSAPNPDAYCCAPRSKCNRQTALCEARTCATSTEACRTELPCCDGELRCVATSVPGAPPPPDGFGRCCRPDGEIAKEVRPGQYDCCSPQLHAIDGGPTRCGPHP